MVNEAVAPSLIAAEAGLTATLLALGFAQGLKGASTVN
jgi:hypothetical protein